mmetsp:Transcript_9413/g.29046  ORF Transcript_9413/g.29046 Transcript_9413/m.29046 type:complete len:166 (-) Transcript_9413:257-754(-)
MVALHPEVQRRGGHMVFLTAQRSEYVRKTRLSWKIPDEIPIWSDPHHRLADRFGLAISPKSGYEHGMIQPGVRVEQPDGRVLFHWAIDPSTQNLGGASDRPVPQEVMRVVYDRLEHPEKEFDPHTPLDLPTEGACTCGAWHYVCCTTQYCCSHALAPGSEPTDEF